MSIESFEVMQFEGEIFSKLAEAERESERTDTRFTTEDVRKAIAEALGDV